MLARLALSGTLGTYNDDYGKRESLKSQLLSYAGRTEQALAFGAALLTWFSGSSDSPAATGVVLLGLL